jgi:cytochrome c peroxidase
MLRVSYPEIRFPFARMVAVCVALVLWAAPARAQVDINPLDANGLPSAPIKSLKGLKPLLPDVSDFIDPTDPAAVLAARQLGKALFWDTQVGSDGTACATCHFQSGADIRVKNQLNPGLRGGDSLFSNRGATRRTGPNDEFAATNFPFRKLQDETDRDSAMLFDTDDVFSSQGTFGGDFVSSKRASNERRIARLGLRRNEKCNLTYAPYDPANPDKTSPFHANSLIYRKVEPRNTPTSINAVFNLRQFWDGRANNQFNGVDPFGRRTYIQEMADPIDPTLKLGNPTAKTTGVIMQISSALPSGPKILSLRQPLIENASLASQAVGPPLSDFEMSCGGKGFPDLGRKLIPLKPLATQLVDANDSTFSQTPGLVGAARIAGLDTTYKELIQKAFRPKWWAATGRIIIDPTGRPVTKIVGGYTQMEHNFSLFWGLAIQAYEQLLITDDSPFDRYMSGEPSAMSPAAIRGMDVFNTKGNCFECHAGPLLSSAAVTNDFFLSPAPVEGMIMRDGNKAMYDGGFYNIGVRPTSEDVGNGALDPYGFDLSYTRQYRWQLYYGAYTSSSVDNFNVNRCTFIGQSGCLNVPNPQRDAVDGAFKAPILRNVALTAPYFHNGGTSNLKDVVRFYNRGGDRRVDAAGGDTSGFSKKTPLEEINQTNLAPGIGEHIGSARKGLGLTEQEMDDLVEFMLALTDDRVACHSDVFDHPELPIPMGQREAPKLGSSIARDIIATLPATGTLGLKAVTGECFPNTGDLFDTLNKTDTRGLQATFKRILRQSASQ